MEMDTVDVKEETKEESYVPPDATVMETELEDLEFTMELIEALS